MATWDLISLYNSNDETINFGTRVFVESNNTIYETNTLAVVNSNGKVNNNPTILLVSNNQHICIIINNILNVFNKNLVNEVYTSFESNIDCVFLTDWGEYLIVCLSDSCIHCLHIPSGGHLVFSKCINEFCHGEKQFFSSILIENSNELSETMQFIIVCQTGDVYRININNLLNIYEQSNSHSANQSLNASDNTSNKFISYNADENITLQHITKFHNFDNNISAVALIKNYNFDNSVNTFVLIGGCALIKLNYDDYKKLSIPIPQKLKKIEIFSKDELALCLLEDGKIYFLCLVSFQLYPLDLPPLHDFLLMEGTTPDESSNILLLTKPNKELHSYIKLISYPDLSSIYEIKVSSNAYLMQMHQNVEEPIFVEGISNTEESFIDTLRIKSISESLPEFRLEKILKRYRFDEAEQFAMKFKLNLHIVHSAKVRYTLDLLQIANKDEQKQIKLITQLKDVLEKITDVPFVVESCQNAMFCSISQMKDLILYSQIRLENALEKDQNNLQFLKLKSNLFDTILRLETFELVIKMNGIGIKLDFNEWIEFSRVDFLEAIVKYLQNENFPQAVLLWCRHYISILEKHNSACVLKLIEAIPTNASLTDLYPWFRHFFNIVLYEYPQFKNTIITYIFKKIKSLEISHRNEWPECALAHAQEILPLLNVADNNSDPILMFNQQSSTSNSNIHDLVCLIKNLNELCNLKQEYNVIISLSAYTELSTESVVHNLLDCVSPERYSQIMPFLDQYMFNHSLKSDEVFFRYIEGIISDSLDWWNTTEAEWENHVLSLTEYIQGIDTKLKLTIKVLEAAPVPWTKRLENYAKDGLSLRHPLINEITLQITNAKLKLILKKYNFKIEIKALHSRQLFQFINHLIWQQRPEFFDDLKFIISAYPFLEVSAYIMLIQYYIRKGRLSEVINILYTLKSNILNECCNYILHCSEFTLDKKYIDLLNDVAKHLKRLNISNRKYDCIDIHVKNIRSLCTLKNDFQITISNYSSYPERFCVFNQFIKNEAKDLESVDNTVACTDYYNKAIRRICHFSELIEFRRTEGLYTLSTHCSNRKIIICIARYLLQGNFTDIDCNELKMLCSIIQQLLKPQNIEFNTMFSTSVSSSLHHNKESIEAVVLASQLIKELFLQANISNELIELSRWTHMLEQLVIDSKMLSTIEDEHFSSHHLFSSDLPNKLCLAPFYKDTPVGSNSILELVKESCCIFQNIVEYCPRSSNPINFSLSRRKYQDFPSQSEISTKITSLKSVINQLQSNQQDLIALRIMCAFNQIYISEEISKWIHRSVPLLLKKVICANKFDLGLGIMLLKIFDKNDALNLINKFIKLYRTDINRLSSVTLLGIKYCSSTDQPESVIKKLQKIDLRCRWVPKLIEYGRSPQDAFTDDIDLLIQLIMRSKEVKAGVIEKFCKDFDLSIEKYLLIFLKNILLRWEPEIEILSTHGKNNILIKNSEKELYKECKDIINRIKNKNIVIDQLKITWNEVNYYNYEVYICILVLLEEINPDPIKSNQLVILNFLKNYNREQKPQQWEKEKWNLKFIDSCYLPKIAEWRLPAITFFESDKLKIIRPELNLDTCEQWIGIAPILNLDADHIYMYTIKDTIRNISWTGQLCESATKNNSQEAWYLHPRKKNLLERIMKCVENVSKLDMAVGLMFHVTINTPPGADRLIAATHCYRLSQQIDSSETCLEKVQQKYLTTVCAHILHSNGLGSMEHLSNQPKELINALYEHSSIIERVHSTVSYLPDINKVTEEIAKLFQLDIDTIRYELIKKWLQFNNCSPNDNMTLDGTFCSLPLSSENKMSDSVNPEFDDNLIRVCYILQANNIETSVYHMLIIGMNIENKSDQTLLNQSTIDIENRSISMQLRALQCLLCIADSAQVEKYVGMSVTELKEHMQMLWCLTQLESIGLTYSQEAWNSCDKLCILQTLWSIHAHRPPALRLMIVLLKEVVEPQVHLWRMILTQMINLSMKSDIKQLLPKLIKRCPYLISSTEYLEAWVFIIKTPFAQTPLPLNEIAEKECIDSLLLLQTCPVVSQLPLISIMEHCLRLNRPDMAAVLLPYLDISSNDTLIKKILEKDNSLIFEGLKYLEYVGVATVKQAVNILNVHQVSVVCKVKNSDS